MVASWIGDDHPDCPPRARETTSIELLQVSVFLAGFSGLYFTVFAITDDVYRKQFFTVIMHELERAVSMRVIYRRLRRTRRVPTT